MWVRHARIRRGRVQYAIRGRPKTRKPAPERGILERGWHWTASRKEASPLPRSWMRHVAGHVVDGWSESHEPCSTICGFRLGTSGSPVAASGVRCRRHRRRVVVLYGGGCRHIPGRPGPSFPLRTFGCRKLCEEPRCPSGPTSSSRWRAVEPFSGDLEDRGAWNADRPSLAEWIEALSGNRCRADADPAACAMRPLSHGLHRLWDPR